jgi:hypothetical protein
VSKSVNLHIFYLDVHELLGAGTMVNPDSVSDELAGPPIRSISLGTERSLIIVCQPLKSFKSERDKEVPWVHRSIAGS